MLILVLGSLLCPPDIVGAGRQLLKSNNRHLDITQYLVPSPVRQNFQGIIEGLRLEK